MKIQLIDKNIDMFRQWRFYFNDCPDFVFHHGDVFDLPTDCIVSPANSFGFMDGGLDLIISLQLGWQVQEKLQEQIRNKYNGELLVGQAELVETDYKDIPFCISAPTMRVPMILEDSPNVYLASRAVFLLLKNEDRIKTVTMSGFGTGVGRVPYDVCAKQMRIAYGNVMLGEYKFPETWDEASLNNYNLCWGPGRK